MVGRDAGLQIHEYLVPGVVFIRSSALDMVPRTGIEIEHQREHSYHDYTYRYLYTTWYNNCCTKPPANALHPSDMDGCSGSRGGPGSDSVSSISESSEEGSGSDLRLERGGLGTRARPRVHLIRTREEHRIPSTST